MFLFELKIRKSNYFPRMSSRKSNDTIVDEHISKRSKISKEDADAESKIYERNKNRSFMDLIQSLDLSKITQNYISVEIITTI